ncbi:MAG TPA: hypothetical protein VK997_11410 [Deferrisomatales bacterium]|nr:hypothetical protein [Deferrisomatales bacterium]
MEELERNVDAAPVDGKRACAKAFELARQLVVSVPQVGEAATATRVQIAACPLGSFK